MGHTGFLSSNLQQESIMRLVTFAALAIIAATPAFAQSTAYPDAGTSSDVAVTPPAANPNVDSQTAAADMARQDYYKDKLDAAKAQSKADSAIADRDAAQDRAAQDRAVARDAENAR
jgi:hypothetical protein